MSEWISINDVDHPIEAPWDERYGKDYRRQVDGNCLVLVENSPHVASIVVCDGVFLKTDPTSIIYFCRSNKWMMPLHWPEPTHWMPLPSPPTELVDSGSKLVGDS